MKPPETGGDEAPSRPLSRASRAESMGSLADFSGPGFNQPSPADYEYSHRNRQVSLGATDQSPLTNLIRFLKVTCEAVPVPVPVLVADQVGAVWEAGGPSCRADLSYPPVLLSSLRIIQTPVRRSVRP